MSLVVLQGPKPPPGCHFCTYCILEYKATIVHHFADEINELQDDGKDRDVIWDMKERAKAIPGIRQPYVACGVAPVNGNPNWGMAWTCWTHAAYVPQIIGVQTAPSGLAIANADVDTVMASMKGQTLLPGAKGQRG